MDRWDMIKAGILIFLASLGFVCLVHDIYVDKTYCHESYCHEKSMHGYDHCYKHRNNDYKYREDQKELERELKKIRGSSYKSSSSKSSNYSYSSSKKSSSTKKEPFHDPADYDDPEDYADDAWGVDFDDWDDAYDYWEDY